MFTFFWHAPSPFSQWTPCTFTVGGNTFSCTEQFMMHGKAMLFGDHATALEILGTTDPATQKRLGRRVTPFDDAVWKRERERIVYEGNHAKFTQNPALLEALLATRGTTLVEASPLDRVWGVGMAASNPAIHDPSKWRGLNLLGKVLTRLRDDLIAAQTQPTP
jgi:ribA/ribD-fused uncharacterized protein